MARPGAVMHRTTILALGALFGRCAVGAEKMAGKWRGKPLLGHIWGTSPGYEPPHPPVLWGGGATPTPPHPRIVGGGAVQSVSGTG